MDDKKLEKEYKEKKLDIWEELMNDIGKERNKIAIKANEYIKQGITAPEAFAKARDEFQEEVEEINRRHDERFFKLNEEYRKKGLLA